MQPGDSVAVGLPARGVGRPHVPGAGHGHTGAHTALPRSTGEDTLQSQGQGISLVGLALTNMSKVKITNCNSPLFTFLILQIHPIHETKFTV